MITLAACIDTLRRFAESPEELDLLAAVEHVNDTHQPLFDGGRCESCGVQWPCDTWTSTELATVEWLIKRSTAVSASLRAKTVNGHAA